MSEFFPTLRSGVVKSKIATFVALVVKLHHRRNYKIQTIYPSHSTHNSVYIVHTNPFRTEKSYLYDALISGALLNVDCRRKVITVVSRKDYASYRSSCINDIEQCCNIEQLANVDNTSFEYFGTDAMIKFYQNANIGRLYKIIRK